VTSVSPRRGASASRASGSTVLVSLFVLGACSGGGGSGGVGGATTQAELLRVEYGQLADVYCLRDGVQVLYDPDGAETRTPPGRAKGRDVMVGTNIRDQRPTNSTLGDSEITYDFIGSDPDTLQPKLFIPREENSEAFRAAFDALDDQLREVAPMLFGQGGPGLPFGVVPRNVAIRLTFSAARCRRQLLRRARFRWQRDGLRNTGRAVAEDRGRSDAAR
jgi:hypothetical protein